MVWKIGSFKVVIFYKRAYQLVFASVLHHNLAKCVDHPEKSCYIQYGMSSHFNKHVLLILFKEEILDISCHRERTADIIMLYVDWLVANRFSDVLN